MLLPDSPRRGSANTEHGFREFALWPLSNGLYRRVINRRIMSWDGLKDRHPAQPVGR